MLPSICIFFGSFFGLFKSFAHRLFCLTNYHVLEFSIYSILDTSLLSAFIFWGGREWIMPQGMQDLRVKTVPPAVEEQSVNHWPPGKSRKYFLPGFSSP